MIKDVASRSRRESPANSPDRSGRHGEPDPGAPEAVGHDVAHVAGVSDGGVAAAVRQAGRVEMAAGGAAPVGRAAKLVDVEAVAARRQALHLAWGSPAALSDADSADSCTATDNRGGVNSRNNPVGRIFHRNSLCLCDSGILSVSYASFVISTDRFQRRCGLFVNLLDFVTR